MDEHATSEISIYVLIKIRDFALSYLDFQSYVTELRFMEKQLVHVLLYHCV